MLLLVFRFIYALDDRVWNKRSDKMCVHNIFPSTKTEKLIIAFILEVRLRGVDPHVIKVSLFGGLGPLFIYMYFLKFIRQ